VSGGRLLKGRHNAGGELGGFVLDRSALHGPPPPGGAFEALASGPALVHRAREKQQGLAGPSSPLLAEPITPERIFEAAAADDPVAREVIDELVERVAMVMIGVVAVTDPAAIILDGSVGRSMAPYVGRLEDLLRGRVLALPRVTTSALGADGTLIEPSQRRCNWHGRTAPRGSCSGRSAWLAASAIATPTWALVPCAVGTSLAEPAPRPHPGLAWRGGAFAVGAVADTAAVRMSESRRDGW